MVLGVYTVMLLTRIVARFHKRELTFEGSSLTDGSQFAVQKQRQLLS